MSAILAMAAKDLRLLSRDRAGLTFTILFPLFYCVFFGAIFSGWDELAARGAAGMSELDPHAVGIIRQMLNRPNENGGPTSDRSAPHDSGTPTSPHANPPRPTTQYDILFPQAILWSAMGCAAMFSIAFVGERTGGTLDRLRIAPISTAQLLAGKWLACWATTFGSMLVLLLFAVVLFGVFPPRPGLLVFVFSVISLAFSGIMMGMSVFPRTARAAGGVSWSILMTMALFGGGMVPLFMMPQWLARVSVLSPVRWSIEAIEGAVWRDYGVSELLWPITVLVGISIVAFSAGAWALRERISM
jgi:ABC-type Na+ efflux pump permease subunit